MTGPQRYTVPGPVKAHERGQWIRYSAHVRVVKMLHDENERLRDVVEEAIAYVDADSSDGAETIASWRAALQR